MRLGDERGSSAEGLSCDICDPAHWLLISGGPQGDWDAALRLTRRRTPFPLQHRISWGRIGHTGTVRWRNV